MQFSTRSALAALLVTAAQAACPPRYPHSHSSAASASATHSVAPYSNPWTSVMVSPSSTAAAVTPASSSSSSTLTTVVTTASATSSAAASTSSVSTSSSASSLTTDQTNALSTQNDARSDVGEDALTWSASLASDAQSWADHLASTAGSSGTLTHSSGTGQGENLYWQSDSSTPYEAAAAAWVAEKSSYSGEAISNSDAFEEYGHYTQIIWSSTTQVGMGVASDGAGGYYVVARYTPEGNVIGETPTDS